MTKSLITGGTGFVGANLARRLLQEGHEVHLFVRSGKSNWRLEEIQDKITIHKVDLIDQDEIKKTINEIEPEYVFHLATYGGYPGQKDLEATFKTNVLGSMYLMNALEGCKSLKRYVNVGSSSEYGTKTNPMSEDDILEPNTPYGVAKSAQTLLTQHFARERKFPAVMIRLLAVYGPYEEPKRLLTDLMTSYVRGEQPSLSSPDTKRDFVYIGDVCDALIDSLSREECVGEVINIGGGKEISIGELVSKLSESSGKTIEPKWGAAESRSFDSNRWVADITKAAKLLGWQPKHSLEEGLKETFEWYKKNIQLYE